MSTPDRAARNFHAGNRAGVSSGAERADQRSREEHQAARSTSLRDRAPTRFMAMRLFLRRMRRSTRGIRFERDASKPSFRRFREGVSLGGPIVKDRTFYYVAVEQEHNRGQNGSEIDPTVAASINSFLATGAFPGLATRQITTNFFPISQSETEAAGKIDHQLTKSTALMLRYAFTNNREAGDAYNDGGLTDVATRQQLHRR